MRAAVRESKVWPLWCPFSWLRRDVDPTPIAPALAAFFDDVLDQSVSQLNFKAIVDGLGEVLFR